MVYPGVVWLGRERCRCWIGSEPVRHPHQGACCRQPGKRLSMCMKSCCCALYGSC
jgi:hypothetical protein